jgi:hypothetical protein
MKSIIKHKSEMKVQRIGINCRMRKAKNLNHQERLIKNLQTLVIERLIKPNGE